MATSDTMVVQLGLAMMPLCFLASSGLISGMTSGTSGSMRNALELSTNTAPALTMAGANLLAMSFSAAPSTMSMPLKASSQASSTAMSCPFQGSSCPTDRSDASRCSSATGKSRSARIFIISQPTAPVAPRIATLYCFMDSSSFFISQSCRTARGWPSQSQLRPRPR